VFKVAHLLRRCALQRAATRAVMPGLDPGIHDEARRLRALRSALRVATLPALMLRSIAISAFTRVFDALWRCVSKDRKSAIADLRNNNADLG
jgi:hypothetical protein